MYCIVGDLREILVFIRLDFRIVRLLGEVYLFISFRLEKEFFLESKFIN